MSRRAVSVLQVARPELWRQLEAVVDLDAHAGEALDALRRVVKPSFERLLPELRRQGLGVLVRYARRSVQEEEAAREDLRERVRWLPDEARGLLYRAQRHARGGVVHGSHVWDPIEQAPLVDALHGAGLIRALPGEAEPRHGRYRLHEDLPAAPPVTYDFSDAVMEETEDLDAPEDSAVAVLHDLASLAAAISHHPPRRTHAGSLDRATTRRMGRRLGSERIAKEGRLDEEPRWKQALAALEALEAVVMDPATRSLHVEPGLEGVLEGSTAEALDRLVHRLVSEDLQAALPALRAALAQAGEGAVDEMIFLELLAEQHRDVVFAPWLREGRQVYPSAAGQLAIPWNEQAFAVVEGRMLEALLRRARRLGLIRRAPGVFAATADGRLWATGQERAASPVYVSSDLELWVPPESVTPWERYQLERLGRCLARDVVDRYRLERPSLEAWLATHSLDEALELLRRRCPGLPGAVLDLLQSWEASATRFVLTRGVLLEEPVA